MLHISKNATNTLTVTITEKQTLTTPYYLIRLVNAQTKNEYLAFVEDTSAYTDRYNTLTLVETTNPDPSAGQVELPNTGEYLYFIYEKSTNANYTYSANAELERGIAMVTGTAATTYEYNPTTITNYAYNGE